MAHRRSTFPGNSTHYTYLGRQIPFSGEEARRRFREWGYRREIVPPMVLDVEALEVYGLWQDIHTLLGESHWRSLLLFEGPTSPSLTIEFLCSLRFWNNGHLDSKKSRIVPDTRMTFTFRGEEYNMSIRQLGFHLRIYSEEVTQSPAFDQLIRELDSSFDYDTFWHTHSTDTRPFRYTDSTSSYWREPGWRVLSYVLSMSYFGRPQGANRVSKDDIFFFWSLLEHREVNLAVFIARFFASQSSKNRLTIQAGPVVTQLALSLMPAHLIVDLLSLGDSRVRITTINLRNMQFVRPVPESESDEDDDMDVHQVHEPPSQNLPQHHVQPQAHYSTEASSSTSRAPRRPVTIQSLMAGIDRLTVSVSALQGIQEARWDQWQSWTTAQEARQRAQEEQVDRMYSRVEEMYYAQFPDRRPPSGSSGPP